MMPDTVTTENDVRQQKGRQILQETERGVMRIIIEKAEMPVLRRSLPSQDRRHGAGGISQLRHNIIAAGQKIRAEMITLRQFPAQSINKNIKPDFP